MEKRKLTRPQMQIRRMERFVGGSSGNICGAVFWEGDREPELLSKALNRLSESCDALRTVLSMDEPDTQIIRDFAEEPVPVLDFAEEAEYRRYTDTWRLEPLVPEKSLFERRIIRLPGRTGILIKAHHLIADAWTMAFLVEQLQHLLDGETPETGSYAAFAEREEQRFAEPKTGADLAFFRKQLEENPARAFLKPPAVSFKAGRLTCRIGAEEAGRIRAYAEEQETTPFVFFLTVLSAVMYRICGRPESFFVGVPVLNRIDAEDLRTAGMFVNNVPVLLRPMGGRSFSDNLIEMAEDSWFQALRHQKCNYTELLEQTGGQAERLYDVLLSFQTETVPAGGISEVEQYPCGMQPESLQIHIEDRMQTGGFDVHYEYLEEAFTPEEIRRLHGMLCSAAAAALDDDACLLSELDIGAAADQRQLDRTGFPAEPLGRETVADLFDRQLRTQPEAVCLTGRGWQRTRRGFLADVRKVDCLLRQRIRGKNRPVALLFERGPEMVTAIYGVLRAGHAFVPIDPENPAERIRSLLSDSGAEILLTAGLAVPQELPVPAVDISDLPDPDGEEEPPRAEPEGIAYIIYTSGSTGRPKGAAVRNDSLRNRLEWMQRCWPLDNESVILQKTPYTFDVSVWEFLWWGIAGGSLALSAPGEHFLPAAITDAVRDAGVTHLHFVPSVFRLYIAWLAEHPERKADLASLRHVFLSGEAAAAEPINRFHELTGGGPAVHNLYGPTECTIDVTAYDCRAREADPIPIGTPADRTAAYIVDEAGQLLPAGVTGELWIGGIQVGAGYVNRPELTEEAFPPNPFGEGRVYRTGDLVSLREDGQILYHGRRDTQMKLNGRRIEAGEIEAVIARHPAVRAAAVLPERTQAGETLAAYVCGEEVSAAELRRHCLLQLPPAMVPGIWYRIAEMPLSANGKTDRNALPGLERTRCGGETEAEPPRDETEERICRHFSRLLETEITDRHADFLLYGGGSLDVIRLLSEPEYENVTAAEFLSDPTPAGLAAHLREPAGDADRAVRCLIRGNGSGRAAVLFPYAGGTEAGYSALCAAIRKNSPGFPVFFVPYPQSEADCLRAAGELETLAGRYELIFYAHCVGAAPALRILTELEHRGIRIRELIAAGLIPPDPRKGVPAHPWRAVPDAVLKRLLTGAGVPAAFFETAGGPEFLRTFRADTDAYAELLRIPPRTDCPVRLVFAKRDPFARQLRTAVRRWSAYCSDITDMTVLDTDGHYFQTSHAETIARMIAGEPGREESHAAL